MKRPKKNDLFGYIGTRVKITDLYGQVHIGMFGYTKEYSAKYNYRRPGYFTIRNFDFKASHIKEIEVI